MAMASMTRGIVGLNAPRKVRSRFQKALNSQIHSVQAEIDAKNATFSLPSAAYVHLPFCKKRCHYCDFPIVALGSQAQEYTESMENYVNLVCKEILSSTVVSPLKTIFFGGGTPSLIPPKLLHKIIKTLQGKHGFVTEPLEISMEMDPGTFTSDYLTEILDYGVNRVSLGVQVFDDKLLKLCGRSHCLEDVYDAIKLIKGTMVRNWSMDLISSLPYQDLQSWKHSLSEAISAQPSHISVYDLQIEQGTKFGNMYKPGMKPLPCEDLSADFYRMASQMLRGAGYEHYEISNYAKERFRCMHNLVYWKNIEYFAYGLGSTSYVRGRRFTRSRKMKEYAEYVENLVKDKVSDYVEDTVEDQLLNTIMLSLRLADGIDIQALQARFGNNVSMELCESLREFVESGHVALMDDLRQDLRIDQVESTAFVRLADPEGFLLSNEIISRVFSLLPSTRDTNKGILHDSRNKDGRLV